MNELLRAQASLPGRKLRIALIGEIEIVETDLFHETRAVEDMPDLFSQAADDEIAACTKSNA